MDEHLAKVKWSLFLKYGLESFDNWLTLKRDKLKREDVVKALQFDSVRAFARNTVNDYRRKIELIESLLAECWAENVQCGTENVLYRARYKSQKGMFVTKFVDTLAKAEECARFWSLMGLEDVELHKVTLGTVEAKLEKIEAQQRDTL